jgi:hypothetical protein
VSLSSLRRWRLLSLLLVTVSPGAAGTLLPLLHPCPVDSPWLIHEMGPGHHGGHHGGAQAASDAEHHDQSCHCVGSCLVAVALAPPARPAVRFALMLPATQGWTAHDAALLLAPRAALLPPATAPPLS